VADPGGGEECCAPPPFKIYVCHTFMIFFISMKFPRTEWVRDGTGLVLNRTEPKAVRFEENEGVGVNTLISLI